jgi:hypothetical protein
MIKGNYSAFTTGLVSEKYLIKAKAPLNPISSIYFVTFIFGG